MRYCSRTLFVLIISTLSLAAAFVLGSPSSKNMPLVSKAIVASKPMASRQILPNEGPQPLLDLSALTRSADLIVLGEVASIREDGRIALAQGGKTIEGQSMVAELIALSVLKGKLDGATISFAFPVPVTGSGYRSIAQNQFGLFFLRTDGDKHTTIVNPYYPFLVAAPGSPRLEGDDLDRVVSAIADLLTLPRVELRREAVYILDTAPTDKATEALRRATSDDDTVVKWQALAALLRRGDISVLDTAEEVLSHPTPKVEKYLRRNVAVSVEGIRDPRAIATLGRLLAAPDIETRRSSAGALRHMHSTAAIPALLTALENSDSGVRYQGVIGLAELTREDEVPSVELFQKNEQRYVSRWKQWGSSRK